MIDRAPPTGPIQNKNPNSAGVIAKRELPLVQALSRARSLHREGRVEAAKALYRETLRKYPEAGPIHHDLGLIAAQEGKFDQAIAFLEKAMERLPKDATLMGNAAEVYRRAGRFEAAIRTASKAMEFQRVYPEALNAQAASYLALGKLPEAEDALDRAIDYRPNYAEAHANLGELRKRQGDLDRAEKSFRTALKHNPDFLAATVALSEVLSEMGRLKQSIEEIEMALRRHPRDARLEARLGQLHDAGGQIEEAIKHYRRALDLVPVFAECHARLGRIFLRQGNSDEALTEFGESYRLRRGESEGRGAAKGPPPQPRFFCQDRTWTTLAKIRHDRAQLAYLIAEDLLSASYAKALEGFDALCKELESNTSGKAEENAAESNKENTLVQLDVRQKGLVGQHYNLSLYHDPPGKLAAGALNGKVDLSETATEMASKGFSLAGDLLSPECEREIRSFLTASSLWYDCRSRPGCLAADLADGLSCPLLFQIGQEFSERLSPHFAIGTLREVRAYRAVALPSQASPLDICGKTVLVFWVCPDGHKSSGAQGTLTLVDTFGKDGETSNSLDKGGDAGSTDGDASGHEISCQNNRGILFDSKKYQALSRLDYSEDAGCSPFEVILEFDAEKN
jgi:tetratricopeptide (TPR) repeat protein